MAPASGVCSRPLRPGLEQNCDNSSTGASLRQRQRDLDHVRLRAVRGRALVDDELADAVRRLERDRDVERPARPAARRRRDEVVREHLAGRVEQVVLERRLERVRGARSRAAAPRPSSNGSGDSTRIAGVRSSKSAARVALAVDVDRLGRVELRERVDDLGRPLAPSPALNPSRCSSSVGPVVQRREQRVAASTTSARATTGPTFPSRRK